MKIIFNSVKYINILVLSLFIFVNVQSLNAQEINDDTRFDHAKILYQKSLFIAAREEFSKIKNPMYQADLSYYIASSAVKGGQNDGEFLIKQFVKEYPSHYFAQQAFYELGEYYFDKGDYENAIKYFKQSNTSNKDELKFKLGYSFFQLKNYSEALDVFSKLKGKGNNFEYDAAYFQGYIFYDREDFDSAYVYLKTAFQSKAYKEDALMIYVSALYQLEKFQELIDLVAEELPETTNLLIINYLADANYALKSYKTAKNLYTKVLKKAKYRNETNYFKAGYSSYKINNHDDATNYFKRVAVEDDTVGAYASYYLGLIYHSQDNMPFAVTSFENTAKYETQLKEDALFYQGSTLMDIPNYQRAIEVFTLYNTSFNEGKYASQVNEMLSMAYSHTNDYDLAMTYIESLLSLTNSIKRVYQRVTFIKAMSLFNDKKFKESSEIFQKSLVYNADPLITQKSFYWMGECLSVMQNDKDAIFYYRSVKNDDAILYQKAKYGLGYAYFNLKNYDDALVTFSKLQKESELNERYYIDALLRIADCHFALKSYEKGIEYYNKSLEAGNKKKGQIYFQIGLLHRYLDQENEAKRYFTKLINELPNSTKVDQAQFQLGEVDFKTGNEEGAIKSYQAVLTNHPNSPFVPFSLLNQAVVYDNMSNNPASVNNYKEILNRFPRHETARSALLALQGKNASGEFNEFDEFLVKYKTANPNSEALENIEFENARVAFFNQKYEQAISSFIEFKRVYPSSALLVEANYFIGDSYFRNDNFDKALNAFYLIVDEIDFSKHDKVLYRIADMESSKGNLKKGNEFYYKLSQGGTSSRNQIFLERGLMENYLKLNEYDSTIKYGQSLLENSRTGVLVEASANLSLGKSYYFKGDFEQAKVHLLSLVSNSPDERGAEANYYIGKIYFDQKDYKMALESLFSLTNSFKNYELWQGRAFLLMADVYLNTDEVFQAKATLNSLISHSEVTEIVSEAKAKLVVIESMDKNEGSQN
ncbi:MAG: tetratricopeptide repeat protein [Reichenbachiella sp.]